MVFYPFLYAPVQWKQVEIKGKEEAYGAGADGRQRDGTCDGPGNQGRQNDDRVFQIQSQLLRTLILPFAQFTGQHGGQRLVTAEHGSDNAGHTDCRKAPQLAGQLADQALNTG